MKWKPVLYKLLGHRAPVHERVGVETLQRDWTFRRSRPDGVTMLVRLLAMRAQESAPASRMLLPITPKARWIIYFVYLPDGRLATSHRFTLERLRAADAGLAIVCAAPDLGDVPADLRRYGDALYWKELSGFDFSAYALALHELAERSPGADVFVLNDSVFGPFVSMDTLWPTMRWDLTGFTASAEIENHIQSYAFHLRDWNVEKLRRLSDIFPRNVASVTYRDTVYGRESQFAAQASRFMSAGALWYSDGQDCSDPSVFAALPLLNAGFPFLKRSVLLRNAHFYAPDEVLDQLRARAHPVDDLIPAGMA